MAKLIDSIDADRFSPYSESWLLDNHLKLRVFFSDECEIAIFSESGDVADQVYERITKIEIFQGAKLVAPTCFFVVLDKKYLKDFMDVVEKNDVTTLEEGKR